MKKNFIVDIRLKEFSSRGKKNYYSSFNFIEKEYCYLKSSLNFALVQSRFPDVAYVNIYDYSYNRLFYCVSGKLYDCKVINF